MSSLYVIAPLSGDLVVKIGISNDPFERLECLQIGSPIQLRIVGMMPGTRLMEKRLHDALAKHQAHGEWFKFDGDVKKVVKAICECDIDLLLTFII